MSDENEDDVGSVKVKVSSKAIYNAVRNYINNEMKLDPETVRAEVRQKTLELVRELVDKIAHGTGWEDGQLKSRIDRIVDHKIAAVEKMFDDRLKAVLEARVDKYIRQHIRATIKALIQKTKFRAGFFSDDADVTVEIDEQQPPKT